MPSSPTADTLIWVCPQRGSSGGRYSWVWIFSRPGVVRGAGLGAAGGEQERSGGHTSPCVSSGSSSSVGMEGGERLGGLGGKEGGFLNEQLFASCLSSIDKHIFTDPSAELCTFEMDGKMSNGRLHGFHAGYNATPVCHKSVSDTILLCVGLSGTHLGFLSLRARPSLTRKSAMLTSCPARLEQTRHTGTGPFSVFSCRRGVWRRTNEVEEGGRREKEEETGMKRGGSETFLHPYLVYCHP